MVQFCVIVYFNANFGSFVSMMYIACVISKDAEVSVNSLYLLKSNMHACL